MTYVSNKGMRYDTSFRDNLDAIRTAIIDYATEHGPITSRGLFYALVVQGIIDKTDANAAKVGEQVVRLRRLGGLDWDLIADGSRSIIEPLTYRSIHAGVETYLNHLRIDPWADKDKSVLVIVEKDALSGVIEPVTDRYGVPLFPARGYTSVTWLKKIADRIVEDNRPCTIYQLGDFDPSGLDASRAQRDDIVTFVNDVVPVAFERIAITPAQITQMDLARLSLAERATRRPTRALGGSANSMAMAPCPSNSMPYRPMSCGPSFARQSPATSRMMIWRRLIVPASAKLRISGGS